MTWEWRTHVSTPIILLTACDNANDRIAALDAGADYCIAKPFGVQEFSAHVRAALRRTRGAAQGPGAVRAGASRRQASPGGSDRGR
jgi:DNA-binding response OmpR family regulator